MYNYNFYFCKTLKVVDATRVTKLINFLKKPRAKFETRHDSNILNNIYDIARN